MSGLLPAATTHAGNQAPQPASRLERCLAPVVLVLVAALVDWPYFDAGFVLDGIYYDLALSLIELDRANWEDYLLATHGGYPHLLWTLLWAGLRYSLGNNPIAWHMLFIGAHVGSSWATLTIVRRYCGPVAGWTAGIVWAGAAIGGYDNPLLWTSNSEQAVALGLLAAALLFVPYWPERPWIAGGGTALCVAGAALTWGILLCATPVVILQYVLLERPRLDAAARRRANRAIAIVGAGVGLVFGLVALVMAYQGRSDTVFRLTAETLPRFADLLTEPLGGLLFLPATDAGAVRLVRWGLVVFVGATVLLAAPRARRAALAFSTIGISYVAVVVLFRASRDLSDGRYHYVSSFAWSIVVGIAVDAIVRRSPARARGALLVVLLAAGGGYLAFQRHTAHLARQQFDYFFEETTFAAFSRHEELLAWLEADGRRRNTVIRIPELPLAFPPFFQPVFYPLSALRVLRFPEGLPHLEIISPEQATRAEIAAAINLVQSSGLPAADEWTQRWQTVLPELQALAWLAEFADAQGRAIRVPAVAFRHPYPEAPELSLELPISQCLRVAFARPLEGLTLVPEAAISPEEAAELAEQLRQVRHPAARYWEEVYGRLARQPR